MNRKIQNFGHHFYSSRSSIYVVVVGIIVLVLSSKGITKEDVIAMNGDMPKYLMNGVYFYDLIGDLPISNPLEHAYTYFARYPALSLGHHPILLGAAEVPFFAIFGISLFSARVTIVFFMLLAAIAWFFLVTLIYDETVAFLSSLIFITTPFTVKYARMVMSEIPALALVILSTYLFYQYCESDNRKYAFASAIGVSLSIYAKQTTIFMFPVFFLYLLIRKGFRGLFKKEVIISCILIGLLLLPLVPITLKYSHSTLVSLKTSTSKSDVLWYSYYLKVLWQHHLTLPILILSLISIVISAFRRDKRVIIFCFWIVSCYLVITYLAGVKRPRYIIYWIPPYCLFAATTINYLQSRSWKVFVGTMLLILSGYQFAVAFKMEPEYTNGYEEAAQYIVEHKKGECVLYNEVEDTGYFIFFVRKHDPERRMIILRTDKILATSYMRWVPEDRIHSPEAIYDILNKYGVGYVVIEDKESPSRAMEWLREEVKSEKFVLRKEITLRSNNYRMSNVPLAIYEYKDYTPPQEGVILDMDIPLMGDSIKLPFTDLLKKNQ